LQGFDWVKTGFFRIFLNPAGLFMKNIFKTKFLSFCGGISGTGRSENVPLREKSRVYS